MKPYIFHPEASTEYTKAAEYYAAINRELAGRFYDEMERLIVQVRRQPNRFFQFSPPARRALARTFPYSVIYLDEPQGVWVIAIMHAKRKPGYWRQRL